MSKNIRSQYIKNLVADKEALSEELKANTKDSLRSILQETVKDSLRDFLNEDDDKEKDENSFDVEEVDTETTEEPETDETSEVSVEDEDSTDEEGGEETETDIDSVEDDATDDDDMWSSLEKFKGENGEYDLTGMSSEDAVKVLKVMGPEDSVRVVKNSNGSVTLTDDDTDKEYIIDIDGSLTDGGVDADNDTADEESSEYELTINEEDLGYTDNYQNKTAMTTPSNNEPGKHVRTWDKGIPQGTEKPWVGNKGDMSPYNKEVNEANNECNNECGDNCLYEIELDEDDTMPDTDSMGGEQPTMDEGTSIANGSRVKGVKGDTNHSEDDKQRHVHKSYDRVNESQEMSNIIRKANAILAENKELKKISNELRAKIQEAVVINASLAKVVNLVTENSTTRNEKIDILNRFNNVKTIEESKALYETISRELKNAHTVNNGTKLINEQLNEGKTKATETQIYKSDDLNETLDFMHRLMKVK